MRLFLILYILLNSVWIIFFDLQYNLASKRRWALWWRITSLYVGFHIIGFQRILEADFTLEDGSSLISSIASLFWALPWESFMWWLINLFFLRGSRCRVQGPRTNVCPVLSFFRKISSLSSMIIWDKKQHPRRVVPDLESKAGLRTP